MSISPFIQFSRSCSSFSSERFWVPGYPIVILSLEEEFIPSMLASGGERCGKRDGVGGRDWVDLRERTKRSSSVAFFRRYFIRVYVVVCQAKRRTGGSR